MQVLLQKDSCVLRKITGTREWLVEDDFYFKYNGKTYCIPAGFRTDLSSTPRFLWGVFPKSGIYTEAGVIHDYLYRNGLLTRKECDQIYMEVCRICGVGRVRRSLMYTALRTFGGPNYKGD